MKLKPLKLRAYLKLYAHEEFEPSDILAAECLTWDIVRNLGEISDTTYSSILDKLSRQTPPAFALRCGRIAGAADLGVVGYRMMYSRTLEELFETWQRYATLAHPPLISTFYVTNGTWCIDQVPRFPMTIAAMRFCAFAASATCAKMITELTDGPVELISLELPFSCQENALAFEYHQLGFREVRFDCDVFRMTGRASDLQLHLYSQDPDAKAICDQQCRLLTIHKHDDTSIAQRLVSLIASYGGGLNLEQAARHFCVSKRSLHRQLANEGTSFSDCLAQYRFLEAQSLLLKDNVPIKEISWRLGFSDPASFGRAFRKWTDGQSPSDWRCAN